MFAPAQVQLTLRFALAIPSLRSLQVLPPHQNKDNATALSFFVGNGLETKQRQNKKANRRVRFLGWLG